MREILEAVEYFVSCPVEDKPRGASVETCKHCPLALAGEGVTMCERLVQVAEMWRPPGVYSSVSELIQALLNRD